MMLLALLLLLLLLVIVGIPIVLCMGAVGLAGMLVLPGVNPALFPQRMFGMLNNYALLALPFFILAGSMMSHGGLSTQLVRFARTLVGHLRAGLCHASVVSSMVFANVSGSSTADCAAIGSVVIPTMKEAGYKPGFAAALMACTGTIAAIIPPSMIMVVYGSMAQVSIGGLFLSGIVPGIMLGAFLMITIKILSYLPGFPELRVTSGKFDLCEVWRAVKEVRPALLAPVVIMGGILTGVFTATEAGIVACFYAFLISRFVYRQLAIHDLPHIFLDAAITTSMVSGIIAMAGGFGWLLQYLEFNELAISLLSSVAHTKTGILIALATTMIVLTMFVESMAVLIIFVPVAVYVGQTYHVDPFQLGLIMVLANQTGSTTPPVAVLLFVTTSIAKTTYDQTVRYVFPFVFAELLVLASVVLFEPIASTLPNLVLK